MKTLGIYIHIPFCVQKCNYCDFLSAPATKEQQQRYIEALKIEIKQEAPQYKDYTAETIFFGGGTPSILDAAQLAECIAVLYEYFSFAKNTEITVETNPGTATRQKLAALRSAGVNRLSIGVQSANNQELKMLGRIHTYQDFLQTYQWARVVGFTNINIDLISALPGQTLASWNATLKKVTMLKPEHISAYSLMIEEGTPFYERYHDHPELLPGEDEEREMYYATKQFLREQGYERYEISNYAKPGRECRHNIGYWTGTEYLGVGLGASSYVGGTRFRNERDLETYCRIPMKENEADKWLHQDIVKLSSKEMMEEYMFLGLRMIDGVSCEEFMRRFKADVWDVYGDVLRRLAGNRLIITDGSSVRLSDFGIDISNYVLSEFLL